MISADYSVSPDFRGYASTKFSQLTLAQTIGITVLPLLGMGLYLWTSLNRQDSQNEFFNGRRFSTFSSVCQRIHPFSFGTCKPLSVLQGEIDEMDWQEKLRAEPPRPLQSYPIDREKANEWVQAHCTSNDREVAKAFIEATRHISHAEFEEALQESVAQFNRYLAVQPSKDYLLFVSEKGKSNRWVAELALKYLDPLPVNVLKMDLVSFMDQKKRQISASNFFVNNEIVKYMKEHPEAKQLLVIDDAAYSCKQTKSFVISLGWIDTLIRCGFQGTQCTPEETLRLLDTDQSRNISVIIPFMRDPKCVFMKSGVSLDAFLPEPNIDDSIRVFTSEKLQTLGEILSSDHYESFLKLYSQNPRWSMPRTGAMIPIYFDHKIADAVSSFPHIYGAGLISASDCQDQDPTIPFIGNITPPYKNL